MPHLPCYLQSRVSWCTNMAFTIFAPVLKYSPLLTSLRHICHEKICEHSNNNNSNKNEINNNNNNNNNNSVEPRFTDTHFIRTPHYYGRFALSLGKYSPYIFSKFNSLNTDTHSVSVLTRFDCLNFTVQLCNAPFHCFEHVRLLFSTNRS